MHNVPIMVDEMGAGYFPVMLLGLTFLHEFNVTMYFDRGEVLFRARKAWR